MSADGTKQTAVSGHYGGGHIYTSNVFSNVGIGTTTPGGTLSISSTNILGTTTSSALNLSANSLTTGTGLYAGSSTLTTGDLMDLQVSGTAAGASQTALNILTQGANVTNTITTYGGYFSNIHTGTTSTNVGLYLNASGATNNYGLIVAAGNVGIGTTTPTAKLHVVGAAGTVSLEVNSNETTPGSNILMLRSDVVPGDDPVFRVQANGLVFADGAYTGSGADYAEYFSTKDTNLQPGEAVCIDPTKENAVRRCQNDGDNNIMGIVSSRPSIIGNRTAAQENDPTHFAIIGMLGQVAGRVTNENGDIKVGDSLTSASIPGQMRKANAGESTVGIAMENFNNSTGTIQVLIARRNQSLTVEKVQQQVTDNIASLNLKDQVDNLVGQASTNLDKKLASSASELANLQTQLADQVIITNKLQAQIDELKLQNQKYAAFDSLIANISNIDNLIFKDSLGNLDLLGGKLTASEIEAGVLTIKVVDLASPTIGTGVIKAGESSVIISTKAVGADSKIFVTVSKSSKAVPIKTGLIIPGESFVVEMNDPLLDELEFNWWIVQEKN